MKVIITKHVGNEVNQIEGTGSASECIDLARQIGRATFMAPRIVGSPEPMIVHTSMKERLEKVAEENKKLFSIYEEREIIPGGLTHSHEMPVNEEIEEITENIEQAINEEAEQGCDDTEDEWAELRRAMMKNGYDGNGISRVVNHCKKEGISPEHALEAIKWQKQ